MKIAQRWLVVERLLIVSATLIIVGILQESALLFGGGAFINFVIACWLLWRDGQLIIWSTLFIFVSCALIIVSGLQESALLFVGGAVIFVATICWRLWRYFVDRAPTIETLELEEGGK